jgi:tetratricopeptide (TPR) repeat protein
MYYQTRLNHSKAENMKHFNLFGIILLILFMVSCQPQYTKNEKILRAETLLNSLPDSAYQILSSIQQPQQMSDADYAAWCMLYSFVQTKLNREIKSDSLILIAVNYYNNSRLKEQSGTSWYLLGNIYQKLKKNNDAMFALKRAEDILNETNENKVKGLVDFYMGYIYKQDELYIQSVIYFRKSLKYFILSKEKKYQAFVYREISDMYFELDYPFDSVMHFSNLALKMSKEAGDSMYYYNVLARQGEILYNKDYARAKEYLLKGYRVLPDRRNYYSKILSYIYAKLNMPDSANYYLQVSRADTIDLNSKKLKYLVAGYLAEDAGNYKTAFHNFEIAYLIRDSIFQGRLKSQLYKIDKQYDKSKSDEKAATLEIHNRNKVIVITILIILVLAAAIVILSIKSEQKKKLAAITKEKQQLEFKMQLKQAENNQKKEILLSKLQHRIENTLRLNILKMEVTNAEKQNNFIQEITKQSILLETEWQYYIEEVNHLFDGKITALKNKYPQITQSDLIVIAMVSLQMDITNCCSLLNMSLNTMYTRRKRIKKHIGQVGDTDLEKWLAAYMSGDL